MNELNRRLVRRVFHARDFFRERVVFSYIPILGETFSSCCRKNLFYFPFFPLVIYSLVCMLRQIDLLIGEPCPELLCGICQGKPTKEEKDTVLTYIRCLG